VKEYKENYLAHILRIPTNRIPRKLFDGHLKERNKEEGDRQRQREVSLRRDARINSSHTKIETGLKV
jgi:hypothetical protein